MGISDRMSNIAKKWNERKYELMTGQKMENRDKYITEGPNVGVSRTAEVVKKPAKKESAKSTPVKVTKKEVTVETPAGNIGSVDTGNPEVVGPDMAFTKPAPVEERSFNAPAKPASDNSRFSTSNPMGMKKGGKVKCMSSGGSSASSRGDGIAQRGKTRGRMR